MLVIFLVQNALSVPNYIDVISSQNLVLKAQLYKEKREVHTCSPVKTITLVADRGFIIWQILHENEENWVQGVRVHCPSPRSATVFSWIFKYKYWI